MILKILNEIASIGSTKQKQAILEKNKDNELLKRVYRLTYSRGLQYYIKKWPKPGIATQSFGMLTLTDMLDFIEFTLATQSELIMTAFRAAFKAYRMHQVLIMPRFARLTIALGLATAVFPVDAEYYLSLIHI